MREGLVLILVVVLLLVIEFVLFLGLLRLARVVRFADRAP